MLMLKVALLLFLGGSALSANHTAVNPALRSSDGNLLSDLPSDKEFIARRSVTEETSLFQLSRDVKALQQALENEVAKREIADARVAQTMSAFNSAIAVLTSGAAQFTRIDGLVNSLADTRIEFAASIAGERANVEKIVTDGLSGMREEASGAQDALQETVDGIVSQLGTELDNMKTDVVTQVEKAGKVSACADKGQTYDPVADTCRTVVWTRWFDNNWGGENGYVPERVLTFAKWHDETSLKITYYDNFRVHGHGACRASWYVEIDRKRCNDPGRLTFDKYSHQQHNYWMNDHIGNSLHGVCRRTSNGQIKKGTHKIEVYVQTHSCDTYTGHHSQGGYIIVEEVMVTAVSG